MQTGRSRELGRVARASVATLKLLHPGWEYVYYDDADIREFMAAESKEVQATFAAFPRAIQRIDFFRYLEVRRHGGFYFDLDVLLSESLDPLLAEQNVFPFEELTLNRHLRETHGMDWEIGNYAFGAAPDTPFLRAVVENCIRAQREPGWSAPMLRGVPRPFKSEFNVLNTTGPGLLTRTYVENPHLAETVRVLFPHDVRNEEEWHLFGEYGVHLMEGSWRTKGSFLKRRFANYWESAVRRSYRGDDTRRGPVRSPPAPRPQQSVR